MNADVVIDHIARGRTDRVFELLALPDWRDLLMQGEVRPLQWFVYYNDTTALKAVLAAGGDLTSLDLDRELGHAAFFGFWKLCDFLIAHGADVNARLYETWETPLHSALCKAGRPAYGAVVRLLLEHGADPNAQTRPGADSDAFMRDVRTCGETPLHRAAAYADLETIELLLAHGAERSTRDAHGDSPLSWASRHLRPGRILAALAFPPHRISVQGAAAITSDHGAGWGYAIERHQLGDYLPIDSLPPAADDPG